MRSPSPVRRRADVPHDGPWEAPMTPTIRPASRTPSAPLARCRYGRRAGRQRVRIRTQPTPLGLGVDVGLLDRHLDAHDPRILQRLPRSALGDMLHELEVAPGCGERQKVLDHRGVGDVGARPDAAWGSPPCARRRGRSGATAARTRRRPRTSPGAAVERRPRRARPPSPRPCPAIPSPAASTRLRSDHPSGAQRRRVVMAQDIAIKTRSPIEEDRLGPAPPGEAGG